MRLGFHVSIAKGFPAAVEEGLLSGCEAIQVFSGNPRGWTRKPLDEPSVKAFCLARERADLRPLAVHLPYLPNLAAPAGDLRDKSIATLADEMRRAGMLGADFVVAHPGRAGRDGDRKAAMELVARALVDALAGIAEGPLLLLENTSGQAGELGESFEELAVMIRGAESALPGAALGVCLDTAHAFAAGYDQTDEATQDAMFAAFDRVLGRSRLRLIHLNDSLAACGQRRDRHAAAGLGKIGPQGMAALVRRPDLDHLAGIMESPKNSIDDDIANMKRVKRWRESGREGD